MGHIKILSSFIVLLESLPRIRVEADHTPVNRNKEHVFLKALELIITRCLSLAIKTKVKGC